MSQSLVNIMAHVIFSTKNREPWLTPEIEAELYPFMASIGRDKGCPIVAIGGVADHVHLLTTLSRTHGISLLLKDLKSLSSVWLKERYPQLAAFHWQDGYGAFSIGQSQREAVVAYIGRQKDRHRRLSFQEEYVAFLKKYDVPYDERYVWT